MPYWGTRWRRGIVTKNYHWEASMYGRYANLVSGNGFGTDAELARQQRRKTTLVRPEERLEEPPLDHLLGFVWPAILILIGLYFLLPSALSGFVWPVLFILLGALLLFRR
jgi:hypothetical protein